VAWELGLVDPADAAAGVPGVPVVALGGEDLGRERPWDRRSRGTFSELVFDLRVSRLGGGARGDVVIVGHA